MMNQDLNCAVGVPDAKNQIDCIIANEYHMSVIASYLGEPFQKGLSLSTENAPDDVCRDMLLYILIGSTIL